MRGVTSEVATATGFFGIEGRRGVKRRRKRRRLELAMGEPRGFVEGVAVFLAEALCGDGIA